MYSRRSRDLTLNRLPGGGVTFVLRDKSNQKRAFLSGEAGISRYGGSKGWLSLRFLLETSCDRWLRVEKSRERGTRSRQGQYLVEDGFVGFAEGPFFMIDRAVARCGGIENGRGDHLTVAWKAWLRLPASGLSTISTRLRRSLRVRGSGSKDGMLTNGGRRAGMRRRSPPSEPSATARSIC